MSQSTINDFKQEFLRIYYEALANEGQMSIADLEILYWQEMADLLGNPIGANSVLGTQGSAGAPIAIQIPEDRLVGRLTGGVLTGLTVAQSKTLLGAGSANGIATLDSAGKVPVAQLPSTVPETTQSGATYTLAASDAGTQVACSNATGCTVTVPSATFAVGDVVLLRQSSTGPITLAAGGGLTLKVPFGLKSATKDAILYVFFESASIAIVGGDTAAPISTQSGTTYTAVLADAYTTIHCTNAGAVTLTVPANIFTAGQFFAVRQIGAGQVTLTGGGGMTLRLPRGGKTGVQYSTLTVDYISATEAIVSGDATT